MRLTRLRQSYVFDVGVCSISHPEKPWGGEDAFLRPQTIVRWACSTVWAVGAHARSLAKHCETSYVPGVDPLKLLEHAYEQVRRM